MHASKVQTSLILHSLMADLSNQFSFTDQINRADEDPAAGAAAWPATQPASYSYEPTSRAQVINRYRREMIEMVRDEPESGYELSLADIVERPRTVRLEVCDESPVKKETRKAVARSPSMDAGVLILKVFLPFSFGGKRRTSLRCSGGGGISSKVSPRPVADGEMSESEVGDRSNSGSSSSKTNGTGGRTSRRRKFGGCWSFFHKKKWE